MTGMVLFSARDDAVDEIVQFQQRRKRRAVGRRHELHRVSRQAGGGERALHERREREVGVETLLAAPQDGRVAALQAQHGAIDRHVGTRLVDDPDHSDRHADLAQTQAVSGGRLLQYGSHWIGEGGDLPHRFSEVPQADFV
ncbi:MAG: hypothetical protein RLZZ221_1050 [Verrucomicrobiota bacterium]